MVKVQKAKKSRRNGISDNLLAENLTESPKTESVPQIIQHLSSAESSEREWACYAISNITLDKNATLTLIKNDVIRKLNQNLADTMIPVKIAAAGALRNLAIDGGTELCTEMITKDIMTPLLSFFHLSVEEMKNFLNVNLSQELKEHKEKVIILLDNYLSIMWSLCESSEKGTDYLNADKNFLNHLLTILSWTCSDCKKIVTTAAQLLTTLSEENQEMLQQFKENSFIRQFLLDFISYKPEHDEIQLHNIILVSGTIYNMREAFSSHIGRNVMVILLPVVMRALKPNLREMIEMLLKGDHKVLISEIVVMKKEDQQQLESFKKETELWIKACSSISSQQFALELLTNICTVDSSEEWTEDDMIEESVEQEVEMTDDELTETFNMITSSVPILQLIIEKIDYLPNEFYKALNETEKGREVANNITTNQIRAIDCLNNIALVASKEKFAFSQNIFDRLFGIALSVGNYPLIDQGPILESITSAIWSLLREQNVQLNDIQINAILAAATVSTSETIRTNSVGIIGKFTKDSSNPDLVSKSTKVLLRSSRDQSLWVVCESLNAIFDIFSDSDKNSVYVQENTQAELKIIYQQLLQAVKSLSKKTDLYGRTDETILNLKRFIEYKSNPNN